MLKGELSTRRAFHKESFPWVFLPHAYFEINNPLLDILYSLGIF